MAKTIYVLNGPNLNSLGTREPEKYGHSTLKDVEKLCRKTAARYGLEVDFRQTNREGELVDWFHEAKAKKAAGIVINPAGYTTTSVAILDAILAVAIPTIEVHITNIHQRDEFRQHSYISKGAKAVICGFGVEGYALAIQGLAGLIGAKAKSERLDLHSEPGGILSEHELIRELAKLLDETGLSEIEVEREGVRVRVARQSVTQVVAGGARTCRRSRRSRRRRR